MWLISTQLILRNGISSQISSFVAHFRPVSRESVPHVKGVGMEAVRHRGGIVTLVLFYKSLS